MGGDVVGGFGGRAGVGSDVGVFALFHKGFGVLPVGLASEYDAAAGGECFGVGGEGGGGLLYLYKAGAQDGEQFGGGAGVVLLGRDDVGVGRAGVLDGVLADLVEVADEGIAQAGGVA